MTHMYRENTKITAAGRGNTRVSKVFREARKGMSWEACLNTVRKESRK